MKIAVLLLATGIIYNVHSAKTNQTEKEEKEKVQLSQNKTLGGRKIVTLPLAKMPESLNKRKPVVNLEPKMKRPAGLNERNSTVQNNSTRMCIFRYVNDHDHTLVPSSKSREELEKEGLQVYDQLCVGDYDEYGNRISSGALASLVGG